MNEVIEKSLCTGCSACFNICPKGAITMRENEEGFLYPVIDREKCINCGLCLKKCPVLNTKINSALNKCYVAYANDFKIKNNSSSGGIFPLIAQNVLENNGIVIGAMFDNNKLIHCAIRKNSDLDKLKGSKYLQSDLKDIFHFIKNNINDNKILFVGTPCQVAGLNAYLGKKHDNLICIDFVCHGVPSYKLFNKYVKELELEENDKLLNYNFRDKVTGWDTYSNTAIFSNNQITELAKDNVYMKLFLSDLDLRESCYNCNFKLGNKYSDMTLGDFWGVNNKFPEMYNKNGVSAVIINTELGKKIFDIISTNLTYCICDIKDIMQGNPCLYKSILCPSNREKFIKDVDTLKCRDLAKKYVKKPMALKIVSKFKSIIKRFK